MSGVSQRLHQGIRLVVMTQLVLTLVVATVFLIVQGWFQGFSAVYGGAMTMAATWWLGRRIRRAGELGRANPSRGGLVLYTGVAQRFVFIVVAFAVGMGVLKLSPLPLLAAFAAAQFGYVLAASRC